MKILLFVVGLLIGITIGFAFCAVLSAGKDSFDDREEQAKYLENWKKKKEKDRNEF